MQLTDYFLKQIILKANQPELSLMPQECHNCIVASGIYDEYIKELSKEDLVVQLAISKKWACQNNSHKACRSNADALQLDWDIVSMEDKDLIHLLIKEVTELSKNILYYCWVLKENNPPQDIAKLLEAETQRLNSISERLTDIESRNKHQETTR